MGMYDKPLSEETPEETRERNKKLIFSIMKERNLGKIQMIVLLRYIMLGNYCNTDLKSTLEFVDANVTKEEFDRIHESKRVDLHGDFFTYGYNGKYTLNDLKTLNKINGYTFCFKDKYTKCYGPYQGSGGVYIVRLLCEPYRDTSYKIYKFNPKTGYMAYHDSCESLASAKTTAKTLAKGD